MQIEIQLIQDLSLEAVSDLTLKDTPFSYLMLS